MAISLFYLLQTIVFVTSTLGYMRNWKSSRLQQQLKLFEEVPKKSDSNRWERTPRLVALNHKQYRKVLS
jgi:hypothetical protein